METRLKTGEKTVHLTIDGRVREYPAGISFYKIAKEYEKEHAGAGRVLLVMENNELRELLHHARKDSTLKMLTILDPSGSKTYQRSLVLMMMRAIDEIGGDDERFHCIIHFIVGGGLYCTLKDPSAVTDEFLLVLKEKMERLRDRGLPIKKENVSTRKAMKMFCRKGMEDKEELFSYRLSSRTNLYELDGYTDYFYGYMVYDTSYLELFDLTRYADGFVLRFPDQTHPDSIPPFEPAVKLFEVQNASLAWGNLLNIQSVADLNDMVVAGKTKELILTQEAYHEKQLAQIAQQIASDSRRKIVMIAGPSSSSKTTLSHRLSTQLSIYGVTPHPIPVDDYFKNREDTPKNPDGTYNFECLEAIDTEKFNRDMSALLAGERVELPTFNFRTGQREYKGKSLQLGNKDILVIEGIHCLNDQLSYALPRESKFKIYVSALTQLNIDEHNRIPTTDGRLIRRMVRDARTRGTSAQGTIAMWPSVRRGEENYIFPYQDSADVMFNSALIYELAVLKIYAQPLLFGIPRKCPEWAEAKRLLKFLDYFVPIPAEDIPRNSLVREFIGGSCFHV